MLTLLSNPQWLYKINIKEHFTDVGDQESVLKLCEILSPQLNQIIRGIETSSIRQDYKDYCLTELTEIKDNFDFLKELASGEIEESEWDNYSFDGDFEEMFNGYLESLYDIGDLKVNLNGKMRKFIWVG